MVFEEIVVFGESLKIQKGSCKEKQTKYKQANSNKLAFLIGNL